DRMRPYLGPAGPSWDLARLVTEEGAEVLFVIVDPPEPGDPPYLCHKDYQPEGSEGRKHALQDGAIYVRDRTPTRTAKAAEVKALVERARSDDTPAVDMRLTCNASAITLHDSEQMLDRVIDIERDDYRERRARAISDSSPLNPLLTGGFTMPGW